MPFRKCSSPDVARGLGKSLKYKRQLSEDGKQLRRGSLGGALTGESGWRGSQEELRFSYRVPYSLGVPCAKACPHTLLERVT